MWKLSGGTVSNTRIREITEVQPVDEFVRFSRWIWLGNAYRKQGIVQDIPGCVAPGRRSRGRPKEIKVRTMRCEAGDEYWENLDELSQDRASWREFIGALCIPVSAKGID